MTLTAIDRYKRSATDADMEDAIRKIVGQGGRVFHLRDSRQAPELSDLPDLIIVYPPVLAIIELKSHRRPVTDGQREVVDLLERCDQILTGVVRMIPRDGEIGYDEFIGLLEGNQS